jgi:DNA invertase Pin-like site-specific DNA recombinase
MRWLFEIGSTSRKKKREDNIMEKTAIAYASDIIQGNTGGIIDRAFQKARIERYAKENHIRIIAWFEDENFNEFMFGRPKIKELITARESHDYLLVERVGALSSKWKEVRAMLRVMGGKNVKVQSTTTLWDCISQMARSHYRNTIAPSHAIPRAVQAVLTERKRRGYLIGAARGYFFREQRCSAGLFAAKEIGQP